MKILILQLNMRFIFEKYMSEVLVGMDVSGDATRSNYNYLGIVVGVHDRIMQIHDLVKHFPEHMASIDRSERDQIIQSLEFNSITEIAFCVKLDRKNILKNIMNIKRSGGKNLEKGKVLRTYNRVVIQEIKKKLEDFLFSHGVSVTEIVIQCDNDCKYFAKAGALQFTRKGVAYKLSDYVAWCNNKNRRPVSVIEIDFTDVIPIRMKKILNVR